MQAPAADAIGAWLGPAAQCPIVQFRTKGRLVWDAHGQSEKEQKSDDSNAAGRDLEQDEEQIKRAAPLDGNAIQARVFRQFHDETPQRLFAGNKLPRGKFLAMTAQYIASSDLVK